MLNVHSFSLKPVIFGKKAILEQNGFGKYLYKG
jgi:hypothetical protein